MKTAAIVHIEHQISPWINFSPFNRDGHLEIYGGRKPCPARVLPQLIADFRQLENTEVDHLGHCVEIRSQQKVVGLELKTQDIIFR